jgi:methyl-accepting chemotaxis protein
MPQSLRNPKSSGAPGSAPRSRKNAGRSKTDDAGIVLALNRSQAVIEFTLDGTIVTANDNFLNAVGYSLEEIKGRHHSMFVDEAYRQSPEYREFWARLNRGEFVASEFKRLGKGGKEIWIQASYNPIFDAHGKTVKVVKFATDITAEKLKNADYAGQLAAIRKAQAVIEFKLDGTIVTANENFLKTVGYSLEEIQGRHHSLFVDEAQKQSPEYREFWARLNRGEYVAGEFKRFGKGGSEIWIQASYNPIFDASGKPVKVVKFASDITAMVRMEREITENAEHQKKQAEELQAKVDEILAVTNLVAEGDYSREITVSGSDAIGRLGEGLCHFYKTKQAVESKERERTEAEHRQAEEQARKVAQVLAVVSNLAQGDFASPIPDLGDDAIGQVAKALGDAVGSVRRTMEDVREESETAATAAQQLMAVADRVASGAQEQASSLEETASSLEEITSTVKQNTDNAQQARQLTAGSRDLAERGGSVVRDAVEAMVAINQASKRIADIITTIDEIAFQTNLLALNAAVEAARAGEQGRGFAVVAAEVRNLAQRSATAAKEIKSLIQDSGQKVDTGTELVNKSGNTLEEIVTAVKRVADIVTEIAAASKEQLTGLEQVNTAVTQIDQVTQTNASQMEEMATSTQSLVANAEQIRSLIGRFKLDNESREDGGMAERKTVVRESSRPAARKSARSAPVRPQAGGVRPKLKPAVARSARPIPASHPLDAIGASHDGDENGFTEF